MSVFEIALGMRLDTTSRYHRITRASQKSKCLQSDFIIPYERVHCHCARRILTYGLCFFSLANIPTRSVMRITYQRSRIIFTLKFSKIKKKRSWFKFEFRLRILNVEGQRSFQIEIGIETCVHLFNVGIAEQAFQVWSRTKSKLFFSSRKCVFQKKDNF